MTRKRILSVLVSFAVVGVATIFVYRYLRNQASERIMGQMIAVADRMHLEPQDRTETKRLIAAAHGLAFDDALNLTAERGKKFDAEQYVNGLFDRVIAAAGEEGRADLAETIDHERGQFSFTITER